MCGGTPSRLLFVTARWHPKSRRRCGRIFEIGQAQAGLRAFAAHERQALLRAALVRVSAPLREPLPPRRPSHRAQKLNRRSTLLPPATPLPPRQGRHGAGSDAPSSAIRSLPAPRRSAATRQRAGTLPAAYRHRRRRGPAATCRSSPLLEGGSLSCLEAQFRLCSKAGSLQSLTPLASENASRPAPHRRSDAAALIEKIDQSAARDRMDFFKRETSKLPRLPATAAASAAVASAYFP
jgi:hypothetical protein